MENALQRTFTNFSYDAFHLASLRCWLNEYTQFQKNFVFCVWHYEELTDREENKTASCKNVSKISPPSTFFKKRKGEKTSPRFTFRAHCRALYCSECCLNFPTSLTWISRVRRWKNLLLGGTKNSLFWPSWFFPKQKEKKRKEKNQTSAAAL